MSRNKPLEIIGKVPAVDVARGEELVFEAFAPAGPGFENVWTFSVVAPPPVSASEPTHRPAFGATSTEPVRVETGRHVVAGIAIEVSSIADPEKRYHVVPDANGRPSVVVHPTQWPALRRELAEYKVPEGADMDEALSHVGDKLADVMARMEAL